MRYEDFAASALEKELYRAITARRAVILETLATGSIKSFDDYKYWTGYVAALKDFNDMIVTTRKQLQK